MPDLAAACEALARRARQPAAIRLTLADHEEVIRLLGGTCAGFSRGVAALARELPGCAGWPGDPLARAAEALDRAQGFALDAHAAVRRLLADPRCAPAARSRAPGRRPLPAAAASAAQAAGDPGAGIPLAALEQAARHLGDALSFECALAGHAADEAGFDPGCGSVISGHLAEAFGQLRTARYQLKCAAHYAAPRGAA